MSKATWAVILGVIFEAALELGVLTPAAAWDDLVTFLLRLFLAFASLGWLAAHFDLRSKAQHRTGTAMTFVIVSVIGAVVANGVWWLQRPKAPNSEALSGATAGKGFGDIQLPPTPPQDEAPPKVASRPPIAQTAQTSAGPNSPNIIGDHNTVTINSPGEASVIRTFVVEGRLTARLKGGGEIPPGSVDFQAIGGGSDAVVTGPIGEFKLGFVSPVIFRRQGTDQLVVVNTFAAGPSSDLLNRPLESLKNLSLMSVPSVTIVWGSSLEVMTLFEVLVSVNGRQSWYYSYPLDNVTFQQGPLFKIPLAGLAEKFKP